MTCRCFKTANRFLVGAFLKERGRLFCEYLFIWGQIQLELTHFYGIEDSNAKNCTIGSKTSKRGRNFVAKPCICLKNFRKCQRQKFLLNNLLFLSENFFEWAVSKSNVIPLHRYRSFLRSHTKSVWFTECSRHSITYQRVHLLFFDTVIQFFFRRKKSVYQTRGPILSKTTTALSRLHNYSICRNIYIFLRFDVRVPGDNHISSRTHVLCIKTQQGRKTKILQ